MNLDLRLRVQHAVQGRYRVERELGRGGMAVVYGGIDLGNDHPVAIKLLLPAVANALGVDRFLREIELAGALVHPNISRILSTGVAEDLPFYVMPLFKDPSVRERLQARPMSLADATSIGAQVADALGHAHAHGILHRDIKPENLLMHEGAVLVTDFGVGKALNDAGGSRLTETGFIVGTPEYMSPEQAAGDPDLDGRSDFYSLGVVLHEMIAGAPPFTGRTAQQVIAARFTHPPRPLNEVRSGVPPAVVDLVQRLMALRPEDRIADAAQVASQLRSGA